MQLLNENLWSDSGIKINCVNYITYVSTKYM